jgi:hypothetical protein
MGGLVLMLVTVQLFDTDIVVVATQAAAGVAGPLNASKMILFTNTPGLNKSSVLADLTQPTYTGYAAQALTWSVPIRNAMNRIATHTGLLSWVMGDALTPTTVNGYGITDTAGTHLLAAEYFPTPVGLVDTLSFLGVVSEWISDNASPGQCSVVT